ncbi:MAG: PqqD family protein [Gemmatimonadaceae bacterium]
MRREHIRSDAYVYRHVGEEHLLIALRRDRVAPLLQLTATAAVLWERLGEWTPASELAGALVERFDVSPEVAEADVDEFLTQLASIDAIQSREITS